MLRLIQYLIMGHVHEWEIKEEIVFGYVDNNDKHIEKGTSYILQCKCCGILKRQRFAVEE